MSAAHLHDVSKQFWVSHEKPALVRELLPRLIHPLRPEPFWALREIHLDVAPGASLGVIGPNGAGKTTLLSVIAGVTQPTTGTVRVNGNVATLLSVGSGFHPELTGVENIFLNGTLLGMSTREIRRKLEAIIAFSQLDGFIDAPLQTYSAGMQMRLGFAIAVHTDFDILVMDEVTSVGDVAFQTRCLEQLLAFKRAGKTLIIAAQSAEALRPLADRALLLHQGRMFAEGTIDHVRERYAALIPWLAPVGEPLAPMARLVFQGQVERHKPEDIRKVWGTQRGTGDADIEEVRFVDAEERTVTGVDSGAALTVVVRFTAVNPLIDPHIGVAIFRDDGTYCYGPNTRLDGLQFQMLERGTYECRLHLEALQLIPGCYRLSVAVWDILERSPYACHPGRYPFVITGPPLPGVVVLDHVWSDRPADVMVQQPSLAVEGPHGKQAWYRAFEPLTLSVTLPAPHEPETLTLRAECRGPHGALWWVSRWAPPPDLALRRNGAQGYQLHIPQLILLTGRYCWSIGWEIQEKALQPHASAMCMTEIVADRLDHGIVYLPHRWELVPCHVNQLAPLVASRLSA